jgi:hypothetical protein
MVKLHGREDGKTCQGQHSYERRSLFQILHGSLFGGFSAVVALYTFGRKLPSLILQVAAKRVVNLTPEHPI